MLKKTVCILPLLYLTSLAASASVVMEGNRVILDASLAQKTVKFTNNDSFPYIVQVWLSVTPDGKEADGQQNRLAVSPAIFKIGPKQDQVISLLNPAAGQKLTKEQVSYLHFTQVPSMPADQQDKNKLVLIVNSTVKVFLRPSDLPIAYEQMLDFVHYKIEKNTHGCYLEVSNQSPYYLNSIRVSMPSGATKSAIPMTMLAPESAVQLKANCDAVQNAKEIRVSFLNDYGVLQEKTLKAR
ncbi:TPA: molecular chaperone [Kluyvera ascorbata]|nr:molecular chaperone [Kluyvera ascorbata]